MANQFRGSSSTSPQTNELENTMNQAILGAILLSLVGLSNAALAQSGSSEPLKHHGSVRLVPRASSVFAGRLS